MLTQKDAKIIAMIRTNSRESLTVVSRRIQIPVSTIFDKLRKYKEKMITKFTALMDFQQLGYNARATVMIKANPTNKDQLMEYLMKHNNVNTLFKINNGFDFMIDIIFGNVRDLEQFVEDLDERFKMKTKIVYYVVEELMQEEFLVKNVDISESEE